jgi:dihydrofolate synthase/folylpolyglutamate synthase
MPRRPGGEGSPSLATPSAYQDTLRYLAGLEVTRGWDLKLERMRAALALRGHPEERFPALHVAGTNGKGSTAAMLDAILTAAGYRTGLYTSPHLVDFSERIRIGGRTIPHEVVVTLGAELRQALEAHQLALTHFEFVTLLACEWFAREGIDVGVIEVGLGGRLDATNVVCPLVTAITSIAHDHEEYLGASLAAIAGEKAGILKPGVPLALGPLAPEAEAVIMAEARALGVRVARGALADGSSGLCFDGPEGVRWDGLRLALGGAFQRDNAAVALTALAQVRDRLPCPLAAVQEGLAQVRWPGRLTVLRAAPLVLVDGAHNPAGIAALARELPALLGCRRLTLVFAVMADKAWQTMLETLLPRVARVVVTRVGRRGLDPASLARALEGRLPVEVMAEPGAAIAAAVERADPDGAVLVCGSLFLVGEAYAALGMRELFPPWQAPGGDGTDTPL